MPCEKLLKNLSVLFVEDEESLLSLLTNAIGSKFGSYKSATNGEEGLIKNQEMRPDIIITDITMPKMDGLIMMDKIHQENPSLPIIILSAYSDKEKLLHAIDAGVTKYFIKPFDPEELIDYLCKLALNISDSQKIKLLEPYTFDLKNKKLFKNSTIVRLTTRELDLISYLIDAPNNIITNQEIKNNLQKGKVLSDQSVRVLIRRLREKTDKEFIQNLPKQGYALSMPSIG